VGVNWSAIDSALLPRALWAARPGDRADLPPQLADRILIAHRGVDVARMRGAYLMRKVDLLLSFFLIQPLFRAFAALMAALGVRHFVPAAPAYMAPDRAASGGGGAAAAAAAAAAASAVRDGDAHAASVSVERRTFARTFPDGASVLRGLFRSVELREACFRDVVVLYRRALPAAGVKPGEMDVVRDADPAFLQVRMKMWMGEMGEGGDRRRRCPRARRPGCMRRAGSLTQESPNLRSCCCALCRPLTSSSAPPLRN
jgi:hypothetical protein